MSLRGNPLGPIYPPFNWLTSSPMPTGFRRLGASFSPNVLRWPFAVGDFCLAGQPVRQRLRLVKAQVEIAAADGSAPAGTLGLCLAAVAEERQDRFAGDLSHTFMVLSREGE